MEQILNQEAPHFTDASFPRLTDSFAEYKSGEEVFYFPVLVASNKANYIQTEIGLLRGLTKISIGGKILTYVRFVTEEIMAEEIRRQEEGRKPSPLPDSYPLSNLHIRNGVVQATPAIATSQTAIKTQQFNEANIAARNKR